MRRLALALVLSLALAACGSTLGGRKFAETEYKLDPEKALVFLFRHDEFAKIRTPAVHMAGLPVLQFRNKGYAVFYLNPGTYNMKISWPADMMLKPTDHSFTVEGARTYYMRMGVRQIETRAVITGSPVVPVAFITKSESYVTPVTAEEALKILGGCTSVHDALSL